MNHLMRAKKTQRRGKGKLDVKWELRVVSGGVGREARGSADVLGRRSMMCSSNQMI